MSHSNFAQETCRAQEAGRTQETCREQKESREVTFLVASNNVKKTDEIRLALECETRFKVGGIFSLKEAGLRSDPSETGSTFKENAMIKAEVAKRALDEAVFCRRTPKESFCDEPERGTLLERTAGALIVVADDSGLCVDCLNGEPGVFSARYAGEGGSDESRTKRLLKAMSDVGAMEKNERSARFVCAVALVFPDGRKVCVEGRCEGYIALEPSGSLGFGYDPVFLPSADNVSLACISPSRKREISHRGAALRAAASQICDWLDGFEKTEHS